MELLADSGGTKTDWLVKDGESIVAKVRLQGINPTLMSEDEVYSLLSNASQIITKLSEIDNLCNKIESIRFYGSGCRPDKLPMMKRIFSLLYPYTTAIEVGSDIIGAAKALCRSHEGIACILGTGSNSCLWNGERIIQATPCLGYILGDEGGGAVMGKLFINALYKGRLGDKLKNEFEAYFSLNINDIIDRVYRQPRANYFLASLCLFIREKIDENKVLEELVIDNFRAFFHNNIKPYNRPDLPVNFIGSIAFHFEPWLRSAAEKEGFKLGIIKKTPIE